jgi:hypothetical protein
MVEAFAAVIVVTAGSAGVLQFFLALDRSARSAAEATWFVKAGRWCSAAPRRCQDRIALAHLEREERAAARWSAELRDRGIAQWHGDTGVGGPAVHVNGPAALDSNGSHGNGAAAHPAAVAAAPQPTARSEVPAQKGRPRRVAAAGRISSSALPAPNGGPGRVPAPDGRIWSVGPAATNGHAAPAARNGRVAVPLPGDRASVAQHTDASAQHARRGRTHWIWIARPEFYAEPDGTERMDLDPSADFEPRGWWRCDEATRRGDLVLLYRTAPRSDIRYVIEVESDAYPLEHHRAAPPGAYGCDYRVVHKLDPPVSLAHLRADPVTARWTAVRGNFKQRTTVPPEVWDRLATIIAHRDPGAGRLLREGTDGADRRGAVAERALERRLSDEPQRLRRIGLDVEGVGRRVRHPHGGVLDLVFRDRETGDYLVVALRAGRAPRAAVALLLEDVASVADLYGHDARGLLVAADLDRRAELMLRGAGNLAFARLADLGLSAQPA